MNRRSVLTLGLCVGSLWAAAALAAPKAEISTTSWQLDFEFHDPQRLSLTLPGDAHSTTFWYVLYRVTNNTGQDVGFYPLFEVVTDTLQVVGGGSEINPRVYDAIAAQHKKAYPFLAPPSKITGLLLQGEEHARSSVAVFRAFDQDANSFTVYVGGLSAELARVPNPKFDTHRKESDDNVRFFVLRRTLAVVFDLPGDVRTRARATPVRRDRTWVMR